MPSLPNTRHESFAQARFSGMGVMDAYRAAGYEGACPSAASKVSQHPDVKARLTELHNAAATTVAYARMDAVKDLLTIIRARPSEAAEDHPLCEVRSSRNGEYHRFPSKLRALARLVRIMGWDEPTTADAESEEQEPDRMIEALSFVRRKRPEHDEEDQEEANEDGSLTPRQETFARARFAGMGVMEAYRAAGYLGATPQQASKVSRHPAVRARIAELRKAAEDALPYKRHEAINDLITIIHASPSEAGPEQPLCERRMGHDKPYHRFPCKLTAMLLLARLMRWHEPERAPFTPAVKPMDDWDRYVATMNARFKRREEREKAVAASTAGLPVSG